MDEKYIIKHGYSNDSEFIDLLTQYESCMHLMMIEQKHLKLINNFFENLYSDEPL